MAPEFPAAYPAYLTASWPLGIAHSITVRAIRPEDIDIEEQFIRGWSQETRYNRYLGGGVALTQERLEKLTRIDFSRDMALIAVITFDGVESAVGVARYVRLENDVSCEFAIALADLWQGYGIGSKLLAKLIQCARAHGLRHVLGDVLATNTSMQRLARALDFRIEAHPDGGALRRIVLDLA